PSDFPLASIDQDELDQLVARHADLEDVYPLSPMQRLFLSMEAASGHVGFEQWVFRLGGPLDSAALHEAWETTVARHAMLRAAFVADVGREPLQVVERQVETPWAELDWTGEADANADLQSFLESDRERG